MRSGPRDCALGRHLLADFQGVTEERLADQNFIEAVLREAASAAGATPLFGKFHQFGPGLGITGVLLLKESHISIHTWPEYGFAAVDAFMCGDSHPERAIEVVRKALQPAVLRLKDETRGILESELMGLAEK